MINHWDGAFLTLTLLALIIRIRMTGSVEAYLWLGVKEGLLTTTGVVQEQFDWDTDDLLRLQQ